MNILISVITTVAALFILYLHIKYKDEFNEMIYALDDKEYPLYELYYIGLGFLKLINFDIGSKEARKKIKALEEIYGRNYSTYYYYILTGAKVTYIILAIATILLLACLSGNIKVIFWGAVLSALLIWYLDEKVKDEVSARRDELIRTYPQMLSKLMLLVKSGMPIREGWEKVALDNEGILYSEMKLTSEDLTNGVSEIEAYKEFGDRCSVKQIKKFSSLMIQNLQKGSSEVLEFLRDMSKEAWEEKKNLVKIKGEKASSKLIFPIGLIFVGVLIVIMVPMFGGLGL